MDARRWDEMYRSRDQVFSGDPNPVLVAETAGLVPGRALDVGCGEGADAIWLARKGWRVTAVDVSEVALGRAAAASDGDWVEWVRADVADVAPRLGAFDLVSVQYFPLRRRHVSLRGLLDAVAPGGTLLFATHALADLDDPGDYSQPDDIVRLLEPLSWRVQVNETRRRAGPAPVGTRHSHDAVLRALRLT
ncbi:class I SAM-dependent methyltransferase [Spirillospora sp. CA-294931]|uniref:class I SAM-dependent methyltransferase n=1 Tax=Spirillospora sp. CA-294931 TaxID=3240042 RepID=UPI003D8B0515